MMVVAPFAQQLAPGRDLDARALIIAAGILAEFVHHRLGAGLHRRRVARRLAQHRLGVFNRPLHTRRLAVRRLIGLTRPGNRARTVLFVLRDTRQVEHIVIGRGRTFEFGLQQGPGAGIVPRLVKQVRRVRNDRLPHHRFLGALVRPGDAGAYLGQHGRRDVAEAGLVEDDIGVDRAETIRQRQALVVIDVVQCLD